MRNKKWVLFIVISVIMVNLLACDNEKQEDSKITIMTTLFPQYDFAKQIVGDKCEVKLLLPPGVDSHSYEPTPKDIIDINNAEMIIYTGNEMEAWVATILQAIDNEKINVVNVSEGIELLETGAAEHEHEHNHEHSHEHEEELEEENHKVDLEHGHVHGIDPHFFTSPKNAVIMMNTILEQVVKLDPENEAFYRKNAVAYIEKINEVDEKIHHIVEESENKTLYFGGKFALLYFVNEYHLSYVSPFDSCGHESEANPKSIVEIIECMNEHGADTVFYEELVDPKVANMIAEEIDGKTLLLHSCHNVSKEDLEKGVTYVDLMNQNAENLMKGLE